MILVDTTVWIDFFAEKATIQTLKLEEYIHNDDICLCGIVLTEVLQGIRNPSQHANTLSLFNNLIYLNTSKLTHISASEIYRTLRGCGITVRKTLDCIIAAVAMENGIPLLHNDRDFSHIAEHFPLEAA